MTLRIFILFILIANTLLFSYTRENGVRWSEPTPTTYRGNPAFIRYSSTGKVDIYSAITRHADNDPVKDGKKWWVGEYLASHHISSAFTFSLKH